MGEAHEEELDHAASRAARHFPGIVWSADRELKLTAAFGGMLSDPGIELVNPVGQNVAEWGTPGSSLDVAHRRALEGETADFTMYVFGREHRGRVGPLVEDGEIVGVVGLATDLAADEALLAGLQRRLEQQAAIAAVGTAAARGASPAELFELATQSVCESLHADGAAVAEVAGEVLALRAVAGAIPADLTVPYAGSFAADALAQGAPVLVGDTTRGDRGAALVSLGMRTALVAPIAVGERVPMAIGAFAEARHAFSENDVFFVQSLVNVLSAALEREESQRTFRTVFEAAPDGITIFDDDLRVLEVNPASLELLGRPAEEVTGRPLIEFVAAPSQFATQLDRFWRGEVVEVDFSRPNGELRAAEAVGRPGFLPGRHLSFQRDVTARRNLESQLLRSQKMEVVGQLAAGIAHDFNNLLLAVRGLSDLVLQELPPGSPLRTDVEAIHLAGERGMAVVDRLLMSARRATPTARVTSPERVLREVDPLIRQVLPEDVELRMRCEPDVGSVLADGGELEQVVLNLVVNARDAMPQGGVLSVSLTPHELDETRAADLGVAPDEYVVLAVSDSGVGMDEQTRDRIFEPFFTTKEAGTGSGLGLSMVYGFAQAAGGGVAVETAPGEGATISVYLPRIEVAEQLPEVDAGALAEGAGTVLVVDDDELSRYVAKRTLVRLGYTVVSATTGDEAVGIAARRDDLTAIVTDVVMPGLAGVQLLERLRTLRPSVPILLTSGHADDALVERGITQGEWPLVDKPYTASELGTALRDVLGHRSTAGRSRSADRGDESS